MAGKKDAKEKSMTKKANGNGKMSVEGTKGADMAGTTDDPRPGGPFRLRPRFAPWLLSGRGKDADGKREGPGHSRTTSGGL